MKRIVLDLRDRCARTKCNCLIKKSKMAQDKFNRYKPFCSYHCQEWSSLEEAMKSLNQNRN